MLPPCTAQTPRQLDLSDVLSSACELANTRASKILAIRSEQNAALALADFVELFKENWEFIIATEDLAKRMIPSLRGVTASQVGPLPPFELSPDGGVGAKLLVVLPWRPTDTIRQTGRRGTMVSNRRGFDDTTYRESPHRVRRHRPA